MKTKWIIKNDIFLSNLEEELNTFGEQGYTIFSIKETGIIKFRLIAFKEIKGE